jgi:hypothetical protein
MSALALSPEMTAILSEVRDLAAGPSWSSGHYADERLKQTIQDLVDSADDTGCSEDLTVVSRKYVDHLKQALPEL